MSFVSIALIVALLRLAQAHDLTTLTGEVFHDIKITRIEKTGIGVMHRDGVVFLDFSVLRPETRQQLGYSEAAYSAGKIEEAELYRRMQIAVQAASEEQARQTAAQEGTPEPSVQASSGFASESFSLPSYSTRNFRSDHSRESHGTEVFVHDYYRKNGTHVRSYTRSYPHSHK